MNPTEGASIHFVGLPGSRQRSCDVRRWRRPFAADREPWSDREATGRHRHALQRMTSAEGLDEDLSGHHHLSLSVRRREPLFLRCAFAFVVRPRAASIRSISRMVSLHQSILACVARSPERNVIRQYGMSSVSA